MTAAARLPPPASRGYRFDRDAVFGTIGARFVLLKQGMELDLVHRRHRGRTGEQLLEMVRLEIGDPDRPRAPVGGERSSARHAWVNLPSLGMGQWIRYRST